MKKILIILQNLHILVITSLQIYLIKYNNCLFLKEINIDNTLIGLYGFLSK
jgi:hypothetical protein